MTATRWVQMLRSLTRWSTPHYFDRTMWITPETDREGNAMRDVFDDNDDLTPILDSFNAAAQGMSGILAGWVRSLDPDGVQKLGGLMARGVRPGLLLVVAGEGMPPEGAIVLVDQAGGIERAARIDFTTAAITWN